MAWNSTVSDIHTFTTVFTVKNIYHRQKGIDGEQVVYNIHFKVVGTDTDGSGNTYTLEDEMLAFDMSSVDTASSDFINIDDVTDEIAKQWVVDFFAGNNNLDVAFTNLLYGVPDTDGT